MKDLREMTEEELMAHWAEVANEIEYRELVFDFQCSECGERV